MAAEDWEDGESPTEEASRIVAGLARLGSSDEAVRLLGLAGTLQDGIDVTPLHAPLTWIANDKARGFHHAWIASQLLHAPSYLLRCHLDQHPRFHPFPLYAPVALALPRLNRDVAMHLRDAGDDPGVEQPVEHRVYVRLVMRPQPHQQV